VDAAARCLFRVSFLLCVWGMDQCVPIGEDGHQHEAANTGQGMQLQREQRRRYRYRIRVTVDHATAPFAGIGPSHRSLPLRTQSPAILPRSVQHGPRLSCPPAVEPAFKVDKLTGSCQESPNWRSGTYPFGCCRHGSFHVSMSIAASQCSRIVECGS